MSEIANSSNGAMTVFLVGADLKDARFWNAYDNFQEAADFADMHDLKVYVADAFIDYDTAARKRVL